MGTTRSSRPGWRATTSTGPGGTIDLSAELPDDIRVAPGADPRTSVFVRVDIKAAGVADMVFTPVYEIAL